MIPVRNYTHRIKYTVGKLMRNFLINRISVSTFSVIKKFAPIHSRRMRVTGYDLIKRLVINSFITMICRNHFYGH